MKKINTTRFWYIFHNDQLLIEKTPEGGYTIPAGEEPPVGITRSMEFDGNSEHISITASTEMLSEENENYLFMPLRASWDYLEERLYRTAGRASQLLYWDRHSRFCPACGTGTIVSDLPNMKRCPACGYELFPKISPAILALIRKEDQVLLVHARNFRGPFNSLVAGFLEVGESLEECVAREVKEETGLDIKNITYFGSQPWPFPSGLMVGYIADYAGGEICLQDEELTDGEFYSRENLPELPRTLSLARKMIDWWVSNPASSGK